MLKDFLTSIDGIEIYPIVSLIFFVLFFLGAIWYVVRMDKKQVEHMSALPLEPTDNMNENGSFIND